MSFAKKGEALVLIKGKAYVFVYCFVKYNV